MGFNIKTKFENYHKSMKVAVKVEKSIPSNPGIYMYLPGDITFGAILERLEPGQLILP